MVSTNTDNKDKRLKISNEIRLWIIAIFVQGASFLQNQEEREIRLFQLISKGSGFFLANFWFERMRKVVFSLKSR